MLKLQLFKRGVQGTARVTAEAMERVLREIDGERWCPFLVIRTEGEPLTADTFEREVWGESFESGRQRFGKLSRLGHAGTLISCTQRRPGR